MSHVARRKRAIFTLNLFPFCHSRKVGTFCSFSSLAQWILGEGLAPSLAREAPFLAEVRHHWPGGAVPGQGHRSCPERCRPWPGGAIPGQRAPSLARFLARQGHRNWPGAPFLVRVGEEGRRSFPGSHKLIVIIVHLVKFSRRSCWVHWR